MLIHVHVMEYSDRRCTSIRLKFKITFKKL